MSSVDYPLSQIITDDSAASQRWFAQDAVQHVPASAHIQVEVSDNGLLVRGITEIDLEVVFHAVVQRYPNAKAHKPQLRFIDGPPLQEPYYQIVVTTPEDSLGDVMGDLTLRRATIAFIQDSKSGKQLCADIPVGESFGYSTQLRSLTRGRGSFEIKFIGYRPCWRSDGGDPVHVA